MEPNIANYVPLSPVSFLRRSAEIYSSRTAVIDGSRQYDYATLHRRCCQVANYLRDAGLQTGETVAVLAPNTVQLLEAHYAIPGAGGVLCCINIRLDAIGVAFILQHSRARFFFVDHEYLELARQALALLQSPPEVVIYAREESGNLQKGERDYDELLQVASWQPLQLPTDEWQSIALNYTSGTTGDPKGVLLHHRGAYLNACANALAFSLSPRSRYLWTLPMFHCNGWTYSWAVTMVGGVHICLRSVSALSIREAIDQHGVTHFCAAPVVLNMMLNAAADERRTTSHPIQVATGGAAPSSRMIGEMEAEGYVITHLYGMTETYGPSAICLWQPEVDAMDADQKARFMARQGVAHPLLHEITVVDMDNLEPVPRDGQTVGELVVRSNTVMKGYLDNPKATADVFAGGWLHTGDLGVVHADGYIEIRDRSKDVIISGGENISSLELEEALHCHPGVLEAAVVAHPDEKWGETPHAFVCLRQDAVNPVSEQELIDWCRARLARFKAPRHVTFGELPKTATGKIQKFLLRDLARQQAIQQLGGEDKKHVQGV